MSEAAICDDKKTLAVDRAGYRSIRRTIRRDCGFMAELAAAEALDNALRHGKRARYELIDAEDFIELVIENEPLAYQPARLENGGLGIKIINSLVAMGEVAAFHHQVLDKRHYVTLVFPKNQVKAG